MSRMKKLLSALFVAMMIVSMLCSVALADPKVADPDELQARVDAANARIEALVAHAIATPENDVKQLLKDVHAIVREVKIYANKHHAKIGCNMVTYYIDGQYVQIDPLYVVNIRQ